MARLDGLEHGIPPGALRGATLDSAHTARVAAALVAGGTSLTSTLVVFDRLRAPLPVDAPTYRALPPALQQRSAAMLEAINGPFASACRAVRAVAAAGGRVLAGTDSYFLASYPGDVHRELELLVQCGLTPAQALAAGTRAPARWLGAADSLGAVAPGQLADLLVLGGDPLADVRNTWRIRAVVANGRLYPRAALDALVAGAARAPRSAVSDR